MQLIRQNRREYVVYTGGGELRIGDVVYINKELRAVKSVDKSGGAILETFMMTSKDTAIHDTSVKPKKYKSTYNSKHGRVW